MIKLSLRAIYYTRTPVPDTGDSPFKLLVRGVQETSRITCIVFGCQPGLEGNNIMTSGTITFGHTTWKKWARTDLEVFSLSTSSHTLQKYHPSWQGKKKTSTVLPSRKTYRPQQWPAKQEVPNGAIVSNQQLSNGTEDHQIIRRKFMPGTVSLTIYSRLASSRTLD